MFPKKVLGRTLGDSPIAFPGSLFARPTPWFDGSSGKIGAFPKKALGRTLGDSPIAFPGSPFARPTSSGLTDRRENRGIP